MSSSSTETAPAPVEFDPYSNVFFDSPFDTYRRMRDEAPVYYNQKYDFYALTGYDDVSAAYKGTATYSSAHGASLDQVKSDDMNVRDLKLIILMDPPEHERMRKLVSRAFTPRAIAGLESMVRAQISQAIRALNPASFDAVADLSLIHI